MNFSGNKDLYYTVFTVLKNMGMEVPKIKNFKSSLPKQGKGTQQLDTKIFGVSLFKQEWTYESDYPLPKFLAITTDYLMNFSRTVGLFRKSGSLARQRNLRIKVRNGESLEGSDPHDVASLLKQWLRELPEPLIPHCIQDLLVRCQDLDKEDLITASLLSCLLLPPEYLHPLKHLLCFLKNLAMHTAENKMDNENLALIMAPNILPPKVQNISKTCHSLVQLHISVIKLLIENANRVGEVPQSALLQYNFDRSGSELESSAEILDSCPSKSSKQLKTWPVQDLFSGIRKLVGQNAIPAPNLKMSTSETSWESPNILHRSLAQHDTETTFDTSLKNGDKQVFETKSKMGNYRSRAKSFGLLQRKEGKGRKSNRASSKTKRDLVISRSSNFKSNLSDGMNSTFKVLASSNESERKSPTVQFESDESNYENIAMGSSGCSMAAATKEFNSSSPTSRKCSQDGSYETLYWPEPNEKVKAEQLETLQSKRLYENIEIITKCKNESEDFTGKFENSDKLKFSPLNHNSIYDFNCGIRHSSNISIGLHQSKSFLIDSKYKYESEGKSNLNVKVTKKTTRQNSLVRGKPNTIKNGLPSQNFNKTIVLTQSLEINSNVEKINSTPTSNENIPRADDSEKFFSEQDISFILNSANLNLSSLSVNDPPVRKSKSSACSAAKESPTPNKELSYAITLNKEEFSSPLRPKNAPNHLNSRIPKLKHSLGSTPKHLSGTPKLRLSSSVRSSMGHSRIPVLSKDKLNLSSNFEASFNDSCFLTPDKNSCYIPNSITWISGNKYLSMASPHEDIMNKRESIAQILKNNSGNVLEKIQLYDSGSCSTPTIAANKNGRVSLLREGPCRTLSQKQLSNIQNNRKTLFASRSCDTSTNKVRKINKNKTPLKLPHRSFKSSINSEALSPITSHPLKEVTNINFDGKQNPVHNSTSVKYDNFSLKTIVTSRQKSCNLGLSKRNSFSGCTRPKFLKKVSRSESSPSCPRPGNRLFRFIHESTNSPNIPLEINNVNNSSFSPTHPFSYENVEKSASSLSIQKLKSDEMIDEWQYEF